MSEKVLIIEDNTEMAELIERSCNALGYQADRAEDGKIGLNLGLNKNYCIAIVDINLPSLSGFEVCKEFRQAKEKMPILMLTSRTDEIDKVLGLELGADDYVTKPFSLRELQARIKAVLRRSSSNNSEKNDSKKKPPQILSFPDLQIDIGERIVVACGEQIKLTVIEFDLLVYMASNADRLITRDELMAEVWEYKSSSFDSTITSYFSRLRKKLEITPETPKYLQTVHGIGYRFVTK